MGFSTVGSSLWSVVGGDTTVLVVVLLILFLLAVSVSSALFLKTT